MPQTSPERWSGPDGSADPISGGGVGYAVRAVVRPIRFTEPLPRIVGQIEDGLVCELWATRLEAWEGEPAPRLYGFSTRLVAKTLAAVANGESYRAASAAVRTSAHR